MAINNSYNSYKFDSPAESLPNRGLLPILITFEEGGEFKGLRVHSVFLPDGSVWDSTIGGWRVQPKTGVA